MDKDMQAHALSDRFLKFSAEQKVTRLIEENEELKAKYDRSQLINLILGAMFGVAFIMDVVMLFT